MSECVCAGCRSSLLCGVEYPQPVYPTCCVLNVLRVLIDFWITPQLVFVVWFQSVVWFRFWIKVGLSLNLLGVTLGCLRGRGSQILLCSFFPNTSLHINLISAFLNFHYV